MARQFLQPWGYLGKPLLPCVLLSPPPEQRGVLPEKDRSLSLLLFFLFLSCTLFLGRASLRKLWVVDTVCSTSQPSNSDQHFEGKKKQTITYCTEAAGTAARAF